MTKQTPTLRGLACSGPVACSRPESPATHDDTWVTFLEIVESEFGLIAIGIDRSSGAHVYYQHGWCQSESDQHGVSHAPYIHALYGFIDQTSAAEVLVIGCGGGTLPTMLSRTNRRVTVVDVDPKSIEVAQRYFSMDVNIPCAVDDGLEWLSASSKEIDRIVVDAFRGGKVPSHFHSYKFFNLVANCLFPNGLMLMNLVEESDQCQLVESIVASLQSVGLIVRLFEQDSTFDRNVIVMARAVQGLRKPSILMPPNGVTERLAQELDRMRLRAVRPANMSMQPCMPDNLDMGA